MAVTYKNARLALGTSYSTVYTCPAGTTALVLLCQATNVDGTNSADVSAQWLDSSAANAATRLVEALSIPAEAAVNLVAGPLILEAGDQLQLKASASGDIEATISVREES